MQIRVIGDRSKLPDFLNESIEKIEKSTKHYKKFHLNVAIAYGGRQDIIKAVRDIAAWKKLKNKSFTDAEIQTLQHIFEKS